MGTSSTISMKLKDGRYAGVYCHWDGYTSWVGTILKEWYGNYDKAFQLISNGAISTLQPSMSCPVGHTFSNQVRGYTVFYRRDRGDIDSVAFLYDDYDQLIANEGREYNYLLVDDKWKLAHKTSDGTLIRSFRKCTKRIKNLNEQYEMLSYPDHEVTII